MIMTYKILIADDEPDIIEFLRYNLQKEGFEVYCATNGREAVELAGKVHPHLIILDVMMPEMDGIEACEHIRENPELNRCIVTFLTARAEDYSQIAGFEAGGDDYIAKPVRPKVLISRIKALLKRVEPDGPETGRTGSVSIDRDRYLVLTADGGEMTLPRKEFELLALLLSKPGKVFSREEILSHIWGDDVIVGDRTIDVHIRKLREKLGDDLISTVKGVGYKYNG